MKKEEIPASVQPKVLTEEEIVDLHHELETKDHLISIQRLCDKLNTHILDGLSTNEAEKILLTKGRNALSPPKVTPEYIKFLKCLFSGFAILLWACSGLCFILWAIEILLNHEKEGIQWFGVVIIGIIVVSGIFAYVQENKNTKVMESFKKMIPVSSTRPFA